MTKEQHRPFTMAEKFNLLVFAILACAGVAWGLRMLALNGPG